MTFYYLLFIGSVYRRFFLFLCADAYETAKMLCEQYYLTSPDMEITEVNCKPPTSQQPFL